MNRLPNSFFAFVWLVLIGTNILNYYSQETPYQAAVILAASVYFLIAFQQELLALVYSKDYLLVLSMIVLPLLLMLLAERSFGRGVYTTLMCVQLVFVVASVLALRPNLDRARAWAAFSIVAIGATVNLYELLIQNNVWSTAPGRSAGFYINPNISGEALLGYGLVFLTARVGKLKVVDLMLMGLVVVGVFTTFSRAGVLATLVLLTTAVLLRVPRQHVMKTAGGIVMISLVAFAFASFVVSNLDLSKDATTRISSLLEEGGVGDYERDRGIAASNALDLIAEHPVFGAGVRSIDEMREGPHNMFLAMMLQYGIPGLILYLVVILRLILIAYRADRDVSGAVWVYVGWLILFSFASHDLLDDVMTLPLLGFTMAGACRIQAIVSRQNWRPGWRAHSKFKLQRA
jgi:O-antigen ligase